MAINFTLTIEREEYPMLFKIRGDEVNSIISNIFNIGYQAYFPDTSEEKKSTNEVSNKLTILEGTLEKLIGLSSSSSKKGEMAENLLENIINNKYGDITYTNMSQVNHSGDAWLKFDSFDRNIMLESKNYTTKVNKDEITKMRNDMITNNIQWGIFVSWNSPIQGFRNCDIDTFNHQGNVYTIVMLGQLSQDVDRIDMGLQIIRKLINNYSKLDTFPWVTNKIKSDLEKLNELININYQLRNWFEEMEGNIKNSLNKYYTNMREYQCQIDQLVKDITENINGTLSSSIISEQINNSYDYQNILDKYKKNKKMMSVLAKVIDKLKSYGICLNESANDFILCRNNKDIGIIKIQTKKIIITINKFNASCEFIIDSENTESFAFLDLVKNT